MVKGLSSRLWPLAGAALAALAVTSIAGANHAGALLLEHASVPTIAVTRLDGDVSGGPVLDVYNANGGIVAGGLRGTHLDVTGAAPGVEGRTNSTTVGATGVSGSVVSLTPGAASAGVLGANRGTGANGFGVAGVHDGTGIGVDGFTLAGIGVSGTHLGSTGALPGVRGTTQSQSNDAAGVLGLVSSGSSAHDSAGARGLNNGNGSGVAGVSAGGIGVAGSHVAAAGISPGVFGNTSSGAQLASGVWGSNTNGDILSLGVRGEATSGTGVLGQGTIGVLGVGTYAGYFVGDVVVSGTLSKSAGSFRIDHPLEPERSYLQHSFVESPDMMNVYNGNVTTDARGFATVRLPRYFQALNRDFRYQLTAVGPAAWDAKVGVWREMRANRFVLRSDRPHAKVSWQVTGIRKDRYANAHRIRPELAKPAAERGRYLNPELYGAGARSVVPGVRSLQRRSEGPPR